MKVKDPHFILEKIEKYINEDIKGTRYKEVVEIPNWRYFETDMDNHIKDAYFVNYDDSKFTDFKLNDTWGGYDKVAWFRSTVTIPGHWNNQVALKLIVGPRDGGDSTAETLLYINGNPIQGIDVWHDEALLDKSIYNENRTMNLALKAWSGVLVPPKFRTFKIAQLVLLDMNVDKFCFVIDTVVRCVKLLDENDLRSIKLTEVLNDTFKKVNFLNFKSEAYYNSIKEALHFIQSKLDEFAQIEEIKPTVYGVGHSHIDMAWLWRLCATREKASRTFSTVLNLMKQYPEYRFMHSSPQLYKFLKEDYPEIFEQVKQKIEEGQWEITGGMWVESDTNVPSGEALVRQFIYGKRYIKDEFNKDTKLVWLPDVFGYSGALPQIMKKCGMKYFMTTKISWNQYNHFPYDTFNWKGIDGTEIFTHFITTPEDGSWFYTYNGRMSPEDVVGVWKNYKDKNKNDNLLISFGWGDGGGGPTREMLEQSRVMKNIPGIPKVKIDTTENYFERIYNNINHNKLETWDGELYFEYHRGTYTSQASNKKYNRQSEILLHDIEFMSFLSNVLTQSNIYPKEELDNIWERVLLNQFHDILPGSSIRQVYEDTTKDYEEVKVQGTNLLLKAQEQVSNSISINKNSIVVYNTTGFLRDDYICIPYKDNITETTVFIDEMGTLTSQPTKDGVIVVVKDIPQYGFKTILFENKEQTQENIIKVTNNTIENNYYEIKFNNNGEISYLFDKEYNKVVSIDKPMNVFVAYEDKPQRFDAWDIDIYYKEKPYQPFELIEAKVIEQGAVRGVLQYIFKFNNSLITQDIIVYNHSRRIDFKTTVDWKEKQVLLKTYFPVDIHNDFATYEIQFGNIKRPTHTNNEWDFAKFEVCGHKWADLSESNYGVSILNDCKYGYDIQKNTLGLSLIKSPIKPDETADRKIHEFTYSIYPHSGDVTNCDVQKEATNLNMPLLWSQLKANINSNEKIFNSFSIVELNSNHVVIDTIKKAEDEEAYIIRLFEYKNCKDNNVTLKFNIEIKSIVETNLCEEEIQEIELNKNEINFNIGCYEIKTFKIKTV